MNSLKVWSIDFSMEIHIFVSHQTLLTASMQIPTKNTSFHCTWKYELSFFYRDISSNAISFSNVFSGRNHLRVGWCNVIYLNFYHSTPKMRRRAIVFTPFLSYFYPILNKSSLILTVFDFGKRNNCQILNFWIKS